MSISKADLKNTQLVQEVVKAYTADEKPTLRELALQFSITYHTAMAMVRTSLSKEQILHEKTLRYSRGKVGALNPMHEKKGELHHGYKGIISDGKKHLLILRPDWFTSRQGSKHVFLHQVVFCQALGITGIPPGFAIHHIDEDPYNNEIHNLALVTTKGHARIHHPKSEKFSLWEKHVSGILKSKKITVT
jgi:hypothetical protein